MRYGKLGADGPSVSAIALGCMSFGDTSRGGYQWVLGPDEARDVVARAVDAGVNLFDTANLYSDGSSEEITGRLLARYPRDEVLVATKLHPGPEGGGLARDVIMKEVDASLRRLGVDQIDLYQVHRWDYATPIAETLETLHDLVVAGKVRCLGASSMFAWQFAKAQFTADAGGWTRFVSMQNHYNLLYREEEREMMPFCLDQGVAVLPWSPLARGRLTRPWQADSPRLVTDQHARAFYGEADRPVVESVGAVAEARGVSRAQVALSWLCSRPGVTAPIVGVTRMSHLEDALAAVDVVLDDAEVDALTRPYVPHPVVGHR